MQVSIEHASSIIVTQPDLERLGAMLGSAELPNEGVADRLHDELMRAEVVSPELIPSDVVTMRSRVVFADARTGAQREVTLVYPSEADATTKRISVLSPLGTALLGMRVGQLVEWTLPNGRHARYRVLAIRYQPEAAGHFHL